MLAVSRARAAAARLISPVRVGTLPLDASRALSWWLRESPEVAAARKEAELAKLHADKEQAAAAAEASKAAAEASKAAARKANAEADAAAEASKAAARKANAEADAAVAFAALAKPKALAEVAATQAATDSSKAVAANSNAAAASSNAGKWLKYGTLAIGGSLLLGCVLGAAYLGYDHYTHSYRPYLRKQMRAVICAGPSEDVLPHEPFDTPLLVPEPRHSNAVPLLLLGKTGTGKTRLLGKMARKFKDRRVPCVYFRFRATTDGGSSSSPGSSTTAASQPAELSSAAERFFRAVGYPSRPSWLSLWAIGGIKLSLTEGITINVIPAVVTARFTQAVTDLFAVCAELEQERTADATIDEQDRTPVVLADELHDLLDPRISALGGMDVFKRFGNEMTSANVDSLRVRVFAAASGTELRKALADHTTASGFRVRSFFTADPSVKDVRERLLKLGYDTDVAENIIATCGTRLRIITPFLMVKLQDGALIYAKSGDPIDVATELEGIRGAAQADVAQLFTTGTPEERRKLADLLDKLAMPGAEPLPLEDLPASFATPFPKRVLFMGDAACISFQCEPARKAWLQVRSRYIK